MSQFMRVHVSLIGGEPKSTSPPGKTQSGKQDAIHMPWGIRKEIGSLVGWVDLKKSCCLLYTFTLITILMLTKHYLQALNVAVKFHNM